MRFTPSKNHQIFIVLENQQKTTIAIDWGAFECVVCHLILKWIAYLSKNNH
jgi:hypothetical protein